MAEEIATAEAAMKVTVVVDNLSPEGLYAEHGLSFLIETDYGSILFDTGQGDKWIQNLRVLGKDPSALTAIALSHGHYDHTGGVPFASEWIDSMKCYAHPDAFRPKYVADSERMRFIGMPDDSLAYQSRFTLNASPLEVMPGVIVSGYVPIRDKSAITVHDRFFLDDQRQEPDTFRDEQCLVLRDSGSVGVLLGCSHRGVQNNILAAMDVAQTDHLEWVAGGMHLASATTEQLEDLCSFLADRDIGRIICCHCTGDAAFAYLREHLGDKVVQGHVGMEWSLPESNA